MPKTSLRCGVVGFESPEEKKTPASLPSSPPSSLLTSPPTSPTAPVSPTISPARPSSARLACLPHCPPALPPALLPSSPLTSPPTSPTALLPKLSKPGGGVWPLLLKGPRAAVSCAIKTRGFWLKWLFFAPNWGLGALLCPLAGAAKRGLRRTCRP